MNKTHLQNMAARLDSELWAMEPNALRQLAAKLDATSDAEKKTKPKPPAPYTATPDGCVYGAKLKVPRAAGAVAVYPLRGVIGQHQSWFTDVSTESIADTLGGLVANDKVGAIVLAWDSPGGTVSGVPELCEQIRAFQSVKPIYSISDASMYSAAYWLGTAATNTFVVPSGGVGSIGVWTMHMDLSKAYDEIGIDVSLISAGKHKVEGNPFEPLSEEAREAIQADVDEYYTMFLDGVAKNRGVRSSVVESDYGEGRTVLAKAALESGMVDGVTTLPELLGALVPKRRGSSVAAADLAIELAEASM